LINQKKLKKTPKKRIINFEIKEITVGRVIEYSAKVTVQDIKAKTQMGSNELYFAQPVHITASFINRTTKQLYEVKDKLFFNPKRCYFGGVMLYFLCNRCHRQVKTLYCPEGRDKYLCRHCHGLYYMSQLSRGDMVWEWYLKPMQKLGKLEKKLKNKWLRTPAKAKLSQQYRGMRDVLAGGMMKIAEKFEKEAPSEKFIERKR